MKKVVRRSGDQNEDVGLGGDVGAVFISGKDGTVLRFRLKGRLRAGRVPYPRRLGVDADNDVASLAGTFTNRHNEYSGAPGCEPGYLEVIQIR